MEFSVVADYGAMSRRAAEIVWHAAQEKPDLLICLASGDTPTGAYDELAKAPEKLAAARFIQLDEWAGLDAEDPASCARYLQQTVLGPLDVAQERHIAFHGDAEDPAAECRRVEQALAATGPIDVCILGLGRNGHLALNEPSESLDPFCHVATLAKSSRDHPMLDDVTSDVQHGLTLGLANILQAKFVLLLVSGERKRGPLSHLAKRQVTPALPASFLWLHPNAQCICDEAAADHVDLDAA